MIIAQLHLEEENWQRLYIVDERLVDERLVASARGEVSTIGPYLSNQWFVAIHDKNHSSTYFWVDAIRKGD